MQAVTAFCESEDIKDIDKFMYLCFKQGFDIKKYGLLEKTLNEGEKDLIIDENSRKMGGTQEKRVEIEVIREKRVEVPVEVIKEVEKIVEVVKEVPVEKVIIQEVIKEVPVEIVKEIEKIVTITNNEELEKKIFYLNEELEKEKQKFSTKTKEMENNFQNEMSKKEKDLDEFRRTLDIYKTKDKTKLLQDTLQNLRSELQQKNEQIKELEKINKELLNGNTSQAYLLRGSNLNRRI